MEISITANIIRPENLRDMGEIPCHEGRKIMPCKLLRSGQLTSLSEADKDRLINSMKLSQIVEEKQN